MIFVLEGKKMKQRLITAAVGLAVLFVVLYFFDTPVLTAALALLTGIAVYEVLVTPGYLASKVGGLCCALFAGGSVFLLSGERKFYFLALLFFVMILFALMLVFHETFSFSSLSVCAFTCVALPLAFSTVFIMRDLRRNGLFYLILICIAAWVTDSAAYFIGRAFGKHKMSPKLSPHKTVEGAIGGIVVTGILFPLFCFAYWKLFQSTAEFSLLHAVIVGFLCTLSGMAGDLFASAIKRQTGVKDFGKIMPGHGGVMDRFDSFLFVSPALCLLLWIFPIFA